jgi:hypothetical protein
VEEEGIRFTGLLLGRDRRTGLVFLECGVDGTSTSTPRMLHVLLLRVVALNAATAISLLLLLPQSLFKKTSTLTKPTLAHFQTNKQKQPPKNVPKTSLQIHNKNTHRLSHSLSFTHKRNSRFAHNTGIANKRKDSIIQKEKKQSKTLDAERERDVSNVLPSRLQNFPTQIKN